MKILIVSQYFYPENFRVNDLVEELVVREHQVHVLTALPNYPGGTITQGYSWPKRATDSYKGASVFRIPIIARGRGGKIRLILNYLSFLTFALTLGLIRLIKNGPYDAVFVFATSPITSAIPAVVYGKIFRRPVSVWIQDLWPDVVDAVGMIKNRVLIRLIGQVVGWIYRGSEHLLIQSEAFRDSVEFWSKRKANIHYVPNWAPDLYKPQIPRPPEPLKILFAGNIGRAQGLATLVEAIERLQAHNTKVEWHFMGDGSQKFWLKQQIETKNLGHCVFLHERQPEAKMPEFFSQYSCLLVSLSDDATLEKVLPSKAQVYMASGFPILASGKGELERVVREAQCGLVSPAGDAAALVQNVLLLTQLPHTKLIEMGQKGRRYFEANFLKAKTIDKIVSILDQSEARRK